MKQWFVNFIFNQKYRFDLGLQLLVFINFAMMAITMLKVLGISGWYAIPFIPIAFFSVWGMGYVLDKHVRMQRHIEQQSAERSYTWEEFQKQFKKIDEILKRLDK